MRDAGVEPEGVAWSVARAFGSRDEETARVVERAEDQHVDDQIRRRITRRELTDAMRAPFR